MLRRPLLRRRRSPQNKLLHPPVLRTLDRDLPLDRRSQKVRLLLPRSRHRQSNRFHQRLRKPPPTQPHWILHLTLHPSLEAQRNKLRQLLILQ